MKCGYKHSFPDDASLRRITFIVCTAMFLFSCTATKNAYNPDKKFPKEQLHQDYTLLQNILEKKHPSLYWYTSKDSMDMYFEKYRNAIEDSMTEQQFGWKVLAPLTDKIHCGHTSFGMSKAYNKWVSNKRFASFPLFMKVWNDTMVVTQNLNRKDSVFKRGTVITAINGVRNKELIANLFQYMTEDGNANNVNYVRLSSNFPYYHRNVFGYYKEYSVKYIDTTGKEQSIKLPLYEWPKDSTEKKNTVPAVKKTKAERKRERQEGLFSLKIDSTNKAAVITLNTFSSSKLRKFFRQSFHRIKKEEINNVVLDIRSNGGGKMKLSTLLTKYVSRVPFKVADTAFAAAKSLKPYTRYIKSKALNNIGLFFFTKKRKDGNYHFGYWERKTFKPKKTSHFAGNLYILTNGPTFSASSLFCNAMKGQKNVLLVGEETGGGWHGNSGIMIPDITLPNTKMRVRLPLFRLVQWNHVPKTGTGILPDIYIPTSYEALIKGYDKKMQVVMDMIKTGSKK